MPHKPMRVSRESEVAPPVDEIVLPIAVADWRRLKSRLKRYCRRAPPYGSICAALFGMSASAFISLVTQRLAAPDTPRICFEVLLFVMVTTGVIAGVAYVFSRFHQGEVQDKLELIIEDLDVIEARYDTSGYEQEPPPIDGRSLPRPSN